MKQLILCFLFLFITTIICNAEGDEKQNRRKLHNELIGTRFNINNISTPIYGDGRLDISETGNSGFIYPKGGNSACVYSSGFVWGGKIDGQIRTGGTVYRTGLKPGKILPNGIAEDPNLSNVRVYRVRLDYLDGDMQSEVNDGEGNEATIREQYRKDWYEWPAADGAPFDDINMDGWFDPEIDKPGIPGADQTIWYVANDLDSNQTKYLYGSLPFGFEMQVTIWGYNLPAPVGNMMFRKYIVINKGKNVVEDMHFGVWSDPDNGDASDDYVGCDTLLNMGFVYNAVEYDAQYKLTPPSVGFQILQGPIVDGMPDDIANFMGRKIINKKNLPITAFGYIYKCCGSILGDPYQGDYARGTLLLYNYLQGKDGNGELFSIPDQLGGGETPIPYTGNPITREGYLLSHDSPPADYRLMPSMGPFTMMPDDTQEVVIAQIAAGGVEGCTNIGAVGLLKLYALQSKYLYENNFDVPTNLPKPELTAGSLDRGIILNWGNNIEQIKLIENYNQGGFQFQGYNVYQFPVNSTYLKDAKRIATYDIADGLEYIYDRKIFPESGYGTYYISQFGKDTGVERHIKIEDDYLKFRLLNNGTRYYFGVTCYFYNDDPIVYPNNFESDPTIISIMPESLIPGVRLKAEYGDWIASTHLFGDGAADVDIIVIEPAHLTGHNYEITFHESTGQLLWDLEDLTLSEIKLTDQTNTTGTNEYYIIDGFRIIISQDTCKPETCNLLTSNDIFTFTTPEVTEDVELAKIDIEKINVFPNPYYGGHGNELNQYHNYVMFNHLPQRAKFRIFNLAGHLVRTLEKDDDTQFYLWDLQNENRIQAPSGLYIIYIELPDLGKIKILKLAIVQREVVPDRF